MVRQTFLLLGLLALLVPGAVRAGETQSAWPNQIAADLVRLAKVEWRVRIAAAHDCPARAPAAGLTIDYIGAYSPADRGLVRKQTGLGAWPQVLSVQQGGPADNGGILPGDSIIAVGGADVMKLATTMDDPGLLADHLYDIIATSRPGVPLSIVVRRAGRTLSLNLMPRMICSARFVFKDHKGIAAYTDGSTVAIASGAIDFAANDDELALIAGHELAHIIAHDKAPASLFDRRTMEDDADLLGARLALCAGYDVARSLDFWKRLATRDPAHGPAHRSAMERHARLAAATSGLSCI